MPLHFPTTFHQLMFEIFHHQTYYQCFGDASELDGDRIQMHLKEQPHISICHNIKILIDHHHSNLTVISNTTCAKEKLNVARPHFNSAMA